MCAIAGLLSIIEIRQQNEIYNMADLMLHRGPDAQGFAAFDGATIRSIRKGERVVGAKGLFGFDRLSIRDISSKGMQPMLSGDGKVALLFNGEIYNTDVLRQACSDYDYISTSDTEVILANYLKYGVGGCIRRLNGMFALCILDSRLQKLFLARDRMGIKPLYWTKQMGSTFAFASEIKAFLAFSGFKSEINYDALREYFTFGDPLNEQLVKDVYEIEPGSIVEVDLNSLEMKKEVYFDVNDLFHPSEISISESEFRDKLADTLWKAIDSQLASDVTVGVQCSGGVDSSLVAYDVSRLQPHNFRGGVSIIPAEKDYSEEEYIDIISQKAGINVHKFHLDEKYVIDNIERAVWHYESIITYHNVVALLKLSEMSKEYMTVLLSGEGSDELFAGYTWFEDGVFASDIIKMKDCIYDGGMFDSANIVIRGIEGAKTFGDFVVSCTDNIDERVAQNILKPIGYDRNTIYCKRLGFFNSLEGTDFDKHIKYELKTRLRSLLIRQDKTSMANSVENRVPFLDNTMIELAFDTPRDVLIKKHISKEDKKDVRTYHSLKGKYPLKSICGDIYGEHFAYRRKVGFPLPFHKYLVNKDFNSYLHESILPKMRTRGIMDANYVENMIDNLNLNENRWNYAGLWKAITFEVFCQQFIDK